MEDSHDMILLITKSGKVSSDGCHPITASLIVYLTTLSFHSFTRYTMSQITEKSRSRAVKKLNAWKDNEWWFSTTSFSNTIQWETLIQDTSGIMIKLFYH